LLGSQQDKFSELDPTDQSAAGPAHHRGKTPAENDGDVADLVWKYFAEEITEPNTRFKIPAPQSIKDASQKVHGAMDGWIPGSKLSTTIWGDQGRRPKHFPAGSGCRI
jgi:hypothetical protein